MSTSQTFERAIRPQSAVAARGLTASKVKRWLRRVHMYAGLTLLPWLLFFGLSGVLFNHPNVGENVHGERIGPDDLQRLTGLSGWSADAVAKQVVEKLNAASESTYRLDPESSARFTGFTILTAPAPDGRYMLALDVERPAGVLVTRKSRPQSAEAKFSTRQVDLAQFSTHSIEEGVHGLLKARNLPVVSELVAHPKIGPELRFRARDESNRDWNLVYDTRTGEVTGRRSDSWPNIGISQIAAMLHTTHHFPLGIGPLWFWALFQDLLGLAMVFWACSGMIMWWQIKSTRIAGALSFAVAFGVAITVMGGALNHLTFGDVRQQMGPGE